MAQAAHDSLVTIKEARLEKITRGKPYWKPALFNLTLFVPYSEKLSRNDHDEVRDMLYGYILNQGLRVNTDCGVSGFSYPSRSGCEYKFLIEAAGPRAMAFLKSLHAEGKFTDASTADPDATHGLSRHLQNILDTKGLKRRYLPVSEATLSELGHGMAEFAPTDYYKNFISGLNSEMARYREDKKAGRKNTLAQAGHIPSDATTVAIEDAVLAPRSNSCDADKLVITVSVPDSMVPHGIIGSKRHSRGECKAGSPVQKRLEDYFRRQGFSCEHSESPCHHAELGTDRNKPGRHYFDITLEMGDRAIALAHTLKERGKLSELVMEVTGHAKMRAAQDATINSVAKRALPQSVSRDQYGELISGLNDFMNGLNQPINARG